MRSLDRKDLMGFAFLVGYAVSCGYLCFIPNPALTLWKHQTCHCAAGF